MPANTFVGLISGTSMDGIDAVVADFDAGTVRLSASQAYTYTPDLQERLRLAIVDPGSLDVDTIGELDTRIGEAFRDAAVAIIEKAGVESGNVLAIGSHGQTIRHRPDAAHRFTMQLGNPAIIAAGTGIPTVADFRRADLALGGEGAPLTPPFHDWLFRKSGDFRAVLNIGGIANLTILPGNNSEVRGFDTGPGNTLLDAWTQQHRNAAFDNEGSWAAAGTVDEGLLGTMLEDPWFAKEPPKSTGFEYFNMDWLGRQGIADRSPGDIQATLAELSAASIADALLRSAPETKTVLVCGGGVHNTHLLARLQDRLPEASIQSTADAGLDPDWVEACAFAWLAMRTLDGAPGNLPSVTGASREAVLGAVHRP